MRTRSIGFIGGGRVVRILLEGFERGGARPESCVVSDSDSNVLDSLKSRFPAIRTVGEDVADSARQDIVFGALHPPAMKDALPRVAEHLRAEAVFVSLAPVIRLPALKTALGGFERIARMIPNAPSILGSGFNPIAFAAGMAPETKKNLLDWFAVLGECPEVPDEQLEAYAILTAMGPTYFWYQFEELDKLGESFGLEEHTRRHALAQMLHGGVKAFFDAGMRADEVIDLVPVKPLADSENEFRGAYRTRLRALHDKLSQR